MLAGWCNVLLFMLCLIRFFEISNVFNFDFIFLFHQFELLRFEIIVYCCLGSDQELLVSLHSHGQNEEK